MEKKKIVPKKEMEVKEESTYLGYDVKTLITVFLLVTAYPVGVVMMFVWMRWSKWVKFLIVLPLILAVIIPLFLLLGVGTAVVRGGGGFINLDEFREIKRGRINRCPRMQKEIYRQQIPTAVEIKPLDR
ncbi:MAG TPA: hypothetical protein PKI92_01755 [Candidatus Woesebacteria bacterium]|nr:hypothetical protein [Candidatus Woesebacteria bacterium]